MIKKGDKVYHWQTINKIGTVIDIITEANTQMTVGGTTEARVYYVIQYPNQQVVKYRSGDIQKHFD
tara:strand:+ start:19 stop:216 length:198 start_codon:yes stop_codon:yes gene_type:complete